MNDFEDTVEGLAAVALGVYVFMVVINGNLKPFLGELTKEAGFVEFVVALFILYQILKVKELRPVTVPLSVMTGIILAMRVISGSDLSAFKRFAAGQIGLFDLFGSVLSKQA